MSVEVVLLESFANTFTAWMPGQLFQCADQAEADRLVERGLAIPVTSTGVNPAPETETTSTEEAPKAKKRK